MSPIDELPLSLPTAPIPAEVDAEAISKSFLPKLNSLVPESFVQGGVWRDMFALTGTLRTFYGAESICKAWDVTSKHLGVGYFELDLHSPQVFRAGPVSWVQALFTFETAGPPATTCQAIVALVPDEKGEWRIWLLRTILEQLKGQENVDLLDSTQGQTSNTYTQTHFDCVVVGGGQAGLSAGGRLQALGISYVILDNFQEVGDSWKRRYDSCKLHLPRETDAHLPFERTFSSQYPEYLTKNDLAQGYRDWFQKYHINIWTSTTLENGQWDPSTSQWTLNTRREKAQPRSITCSQVVMAVGAGGRVPQMPDYLNREVFCGTVLHSADYANSCAWKGKHGVIIGTANTGHDIAKDMVDSRLAQVTMIQRSSTYVVPAEYIREILGMTYNATFPTDLADKLGHSLPNGILGLLLKGFLSHKAMDEPERFDALERTGFKLERNGNFANNLFIRHGGHYVDVGASKQISQGLIKIKSGSLPRQYTTDGLEFEDGSHLKADVVVFATGFNVNMKNEVRKLFDEEIAEQMGDYWGIDSEGEIRGAWKPCGHPAIRYHGGDQAQARYLSRFVALSIKASLMGAPLPVYDK